MTAGLIVPRTFAELALPVDPVELPERAVVRAHGRSMTLGGGEIAWAWERLVRRTTFDCATGCWVWCGYSKNGYGVLSIRNQDIYIHRLAFALVHGAEPAAGLDVCHKCDNRPCWRAGHLFAGTRQDNVRDAWAKGRATPPPRSAGERHYRAHLTDVEVAEIRGIWAAGGVDQRTIAAAYGVSQSTIWRLIHRAVRP